MSRLTTGISGAIALSVISCAAAQFALGRDLTPAARDETQTIQPPALLTSLVAVNRAAKGDRAAGLAGSAAATRTVSLKLDGFSATTFLLRVPLADANRSSAAPPAIPSAGKPMVACEPVVSVLTEVFKRLGPGRCVA